MRFLAKAPLFETPLHPYTAGLLASVPRLAAMGAEPRTALLSLVLPDAFSLADLDALLEQPGRLEVDLGAHVLAPRSVACKKFASSAGPSGVRTLSG